MWNLLSVSVFAESLASWLVCILSANVMIGVPVCMHCVYVCTLLCVPSYNVYWHVTLNDFRPPVCVGMCGCTFLLIACKFVRVSVFCCATTAPFRLRAVCKCDDWCAGFVCNVCTCVSTYVCHRAMYMDMWRWILFAHTYVCIICLWNMAYVSLFAALFSPRFVYMLSANAMSCVFCIHCV